MLRWVFVRILLLGSTHCPMFCLSSNTSSETEEHFLISRSFPWGMRSASSWGEPERTLTNCSHVHAYSGGINLYASFASVLISHLFVFVRELTQRTLRTSLCCPSTEIPEKYKLQLSVLYKAWMAASIFSSVTSFRRLRNQGKPPIDSQAESLWRFLFILFPFFCFVFFFSLNSRLTWQQESRNSHIFLRLK